MKALTICQPYAELIARGEKPIENRTWETPYRGLLFIHAGKSRAWLSPGDETTYAGMPFGALVATAQLAECLHMERAWPEAYAHLKSNNHAMGPWCWVLEQVTRIAPYPMRGFQGLWYVPREIAVSITMPRQSPVMNRARS